MSQSQSIASQVAQSGLVGGTAPAPTTSIFNPAPAKARTPGNETPLFIAVWGGRNGQSPVLRIVDHTVARFTLADGTKSHCIDLAIPNTANLVTMRNRCDTIIRSVKAQHDIMERKGGPNWQDWDPATINNALNVFNRFGLEFGCTSLAERQQPYRARGESKSTRTPGDTTDDITSPFSAFDPSNLDA